MKADITESGVLVIAGENMVEKLALTQWNASFQQHQAALRIEVATPCSSPAAGGVVPPRVAPLSLVTES